MQEFDLIGEAIEVRSVTNARHPSHHSSFHTAEPNVGNGRIVAIQYCFEIPDLPNHFGSEPGCERILAKVESFPLGTDPIFELAWIFETGSFHLVKKFRAFCRYGTISIKYDFRFWIDGFHLFDKRDIAINLCHHFFRGRRWCAEHERILRNDIEFFQPLRETNDLLARLRAAFV